MGRRAAPGRLQRKGLALRGLLAAMPQPLRLLSAVGSQLMLCLLPVRRLVGAQVVMHLAPRSQAPAWCLGLLVWQARAMGLKAHVLAAPAWHSDASSCLAR